ncbi:GT4 family glycosyltransferase PelF [Hydrogenimonas sp. SS33]|uniref:GT4 family glycosyltransferase PelF n=1 Tax=Hydrogenimonas leucolamina TaxID=2954236 RepID=UPI00336C0F87
MTLPTSESVDIMILAEGTYPFVRGGVSSWIHQLITGMPDLTFGITFLGSRPEEYGGILYELPENLHHLGVYYLFEEQEEVSAPHRDMDGRALEKVNALHRWFKKPEGEIPETMRSLSFYLEEATFAHFMYGKRAWEYIREVYFANASDVPFIDYFWTLRNMHRPIWVLAEIADTVPACSIFHAPSTGYAGFLGALASYHYNRPMLLTEHGIYTRERKIDLLGADWIAYHKPALLMENEEFNYVKEMWIRFFEKIADFAYVRSQKIISLYPGAKAVQILFGAEEKKCEVIPNGVDVDGLSALVSQRPEEVPKVITLIGRVVSIKDIKSFIRALRIVADSMPEVKGWIAGPMDEDPEYAKECMDMVNALKLEENIEFLGFRNIKEILPKSGLLTLTSISEGMPLVVLEGFAAGVPAVTTDVGSCRDLIYGGLDEEDIAIGEAGAVTKIANPAELAENYLKILNDRDVWERMQQNAQRRVDRYYRQETFLQKYRDLYKELETTWQA